jgi:regulator of replication initiation timing
LVIDKREKALADEIPKFNARSADLEEKYNAKFRALEEQRAQLSVTKKTVQQQQTKSEQALAAAQRLTADNDKLAKKLADSRAELQVAREQIPKRSSRRPKSPRPDPGTIHDADDDDDDESDDPDCRIIPNQRPEKKSKHATRDDDLADSLAQLQDRLEALSSENKELQQRLARQSHRSSAKDDDDHESMIPATDVDDETSCGAAVERWLRVERQIPSTERATGPYIGATLSPELFYQEWRRRLLPLPDTRSYVRAEIERMMSILTTAHRLACAPRFPTTIIQYATYENLRMQIENAQRLQMKIAGVTNEAYDTYDTSLPVYRSSNRRARAAFKSSDQLILNLIKKHARQTRRGGRPGGRGGTRNDLRDRATSAAPAPAGESDTASNGSSRAPGQYRRRR